MSTLGLNYNTWDLALDASGNMSIISGGLDIAQDVASAIKLFLGELYYDVTAGIPYFNSVFGPSYSSSTVQNLIQNAALTVPNVVTAIATITNFDYTMRTLTGTVDITTTTGQTITVNFGG
jgi:hypothetical protein